MNKKEKPNLWFAMALGIVTSLPITALSFLSSQIAGLPFIAFNLLDFFTRVLPRVMVFFGIDRLLQGSQQVTTPNLGALSDVLQPTLAVLLVALVGALFGLILTNLGRQEENRKHLNVYGVAGGVLLWLVFGLINNYLGFPPAGPLASILTLGGLMVVWGLLLSVAVRQTFYTPETEDTDQNRRRFLFLAGSTLAAIIAAGLGFLSTGRGSQQGPSPQAGTTDGEAPVFKRNASDEPPSLVEIGLDDTTGPAQSPPLSNLQARIDPAPGTRPEITSIRDFYNIDINTNPPVLNPEDWSVEISGLFDSPRTLTLNDFKSYPVHSQMITIGCISNRVGGDLVSTAKWTGLRLIDLLEDLGIQPEAQELYIEAADGFYESVSMADMMNPRTLLVYEMNDKPLPYEHGYPLRIYIPDRFGMKQPKWITSIEAIDNQGAGYWVDRGWSAEAFVRTTSVFDNVAVDAASDGTVPMGGIAWAGARGISKIEVQIDDGDWREAQLRTPPLSPLTWVQWLYDWPSEPGQHTARVRAYDGTGELQPIEETGRRPDGATGVDLVEFEI